MATAVITTGAQFDALPYDEGRRWELVDGEMIPVSSTTLQHQSIVRKIEVRLALYFADKPEQGEVFAAVEFALSENHRVRPDVFVLRREHLTLVDWEKVPVPGSPDIAIEVISPSERTTDSRQKVDAYLRHGTQEVWQVYPKLKEVVIHCGAAGITLTAAEHIVTPLLPGFTLAVHSLF
jgi:Uma2 family endonuclease